MMNVLSLCLVVTSVATAGVWSPTPEKKNPGEQIIVKEGHGIIVIEYEKEGIGNTKVSISPQDHAQPSHKTIEIDEEKLSTAASSASDITDNAKDKIKDASSVLPNLGQGLSGSQPPSNGHGPGPRELICDALGKCKHKVSGAFSKAKEKAHEVKEEAKEAIETVGEAKETVSQKARELREEAKEKVSEKAREMEESAKETVDKAKHAAKTAVDRSKAIGEDLATNVSEKIETLRQKAAKDLNEIMERGREVAYDAVTYVVSRQPVGSAMSVVQLLGFAMAYGMCVWITFISSYILAAALPRQQFGMVQSKIYPVYFRAMIYCIGLALLGHLWSQRKRVFSSKAEMFQVYNLVVSLLMVFANWKYLEPRATKVMFERMKVEKEEGRGKDGFTAEPSRMAEPTAAAATTKSMTTPTTTATPPGPERLEQIAKSRNDKLNERLKKLNSYSSFLNILTLMALTWHLVYLGQRLNMSC